jgi:hypothetical protein
MMIDDVTDGQQSVKICITLSSHDADFRNFLAHVGEHLKGKQNQTWRGC